MIRLVGMRHLKGRNEERVPGAGVSKFVSKLDSELEERNRQRRPRQCNICSVLVYQRLPQVKQRRHVTPRLSPLSTTVFLRREYRVQCSEIHKDHITQCQIARSVLMWRNRSSHRSSIITATLYVPLERQVSASISVQISELNTFNSSNLNKSGS